MSPPHDGAPRLRTEGPDAVEQTIETDSHSSGSAQSAPEGRFAILDHARRNVELGYVVVPVHSVGPDRKTCSCPKGGNCGRNAGKHPIGNDWQETGEDGLQALGDLIAKGRKPNFGILPEASGIVTVDIDPRNGGDVTMAALVKEHGSLPRTRVRKTGSGGWHYDLIAPEGVRFAGSLGPGVDIKHNGMVVAEGSRSWAGEYSVLSDVAPAAMPQWVIEKGRKPGRTAPTTAVEPPTPEDLTDNERERAERYFAPAIRDEVARLDAMASAAMKDGIGYDGEAWDHTTYAVACNLLEVANTPASGLTTSEAEQLVLDHAPRDGVDFGVERIQRKLDSARKMVGTKARGVPAPPATFPAQHPQTLADETVEDDAVTPTGVDEIAGIAEAEFTDGVVAERFATEMCGRLIHVEGIGWMEYRHGRFVYVPAKRVEALALKSARRLVTEVRHRGKGAVRDAARRLDSPRVRAVEHIARGLDRISVEPDQLDADPYLLNVANGTLDLRTFELRPHDPADHLTKVTAGRYDPDVDMTAWEDFLEQVLPDPQVRDYLARVVGQALVGVVTEHLFAILTGRGGNGKGTFYTALIDTLGSYAQALDPSLLLSSEKGPGGPELMRLKGARVCVGSETNEGRRLDEAEMKRMTGGDRLTARNLYQPPVEWAPTHQLLYVTNYLPIVKGNDEAVWRRVRVIPFTVKVSDADKDVNLASKLAEHIDAVLLWAVQGYRDYLDGGMREPEDVRVATDAYKSQSDDVKRFIEQDCLVSPAATATTRQLYTEWSRWQAREGATHLAESVFSAELTRLGYDSSRTKRGKTWRGLSPYVSAEEGRGGGR